MDYVMSRVSKTSRGVMPRVSIQKASSETVSKALYKVTMDSVLARSVFFCCQDASRFNLPGGIQGISSGQFRQI